MPRSGTASSQDDYRLEPRAADQRRTVTIRGRGSERYTPVRSSRQRHPQRRYERAGFRPDRAAMWAIMLGVVLIVVAAASAHGG